MSETKVLNSEKEILINLIQDMDDEKLNFLYRLINLKYANKDEVLKFCNSSSKNYDTAYPIDYFRSIEEVYPDIKSGEFIFDYTEKSFGELININNVFAKTIFQFINTI